MSLGYMTNAFGELVGSGGGVINAKDVRYVTMCDDEEAIKKITEVGFEYIEILMVIYQGMRIIQRNLLKF